MSSIVLIEQPLPFGIRFVSLISTFNGFMQSAMAILVFWLFPSLTPQMPEYHPTPPAQIRRGRSQSITSVSSTTSTLVNVGFPAEETPAKACDDSFAGDEPVDACPVSSSRRLSNTFGKLTSTIPTPHIFMKPLKPFARRMSATGRRVSFSISSISAPPTPAIEPTSYFCPQSPTKNAAASAELEGFQVALEAKCISFVQSAKPQHEKRMSHMRRISSKTVSLMRFRTKSRSSATISRC